MYFWRPFPNQGRNNKKNCSRVIVNWCWVWKSHWFPLKIITKASISNLISDLCQVGPTFSARYYIWTHPVSNSTTTTGWSSAPVPCFSWDALLASPATTPADSAFSVPWAERYVSEKLIKFTPIKYTLGTLLWKTLQSQNTDAPCKLWYTTTHSMDTSCMHKPG